MGRPARIDRGAVVAAGLAVADELGLGAVTMQAVADRLEVTPMALYRHVANKADLLDAMVEHLLTEFAPPSPGLPWQQRMATQARALRRSAQRHPGVFPLLLQRPVATPEAAEVRGGVYDALALAGVKAPYLAQAERLVSTAVLGFAVSEVSGRFRFHSRQELDDDFDRLLQLLAVVVEAEADR